MKILPDDPLIRWLVGLLVAFSVGVPVLVALILSLQG